MQHKRWKRSLAMMLCATMASSFFSYPVNAVDSGTDTGHSLQTRAEDMMKGMFLIPVTQELGDSYYINFDYMVPAGTLLNQNLLWGSCKSLTDIAKVGPSVLQGTVRNVTNGQGQKVAEQVDEKLTVQTKTKNIPLDVALNRDTWYTITLHYQAERFGLYIDGGLIPLSSDEDGYFDMGETVSIPAFGQVGDTNWRKPPAYEPSASTSGIALYDNISIISQSDTVTYSFDDGVGNVQTSWQRIGAGSVTTNEPILSERNNTPGTLTRMTAEPASSSLMMGQPQLLDSFFMGEGTLSNGQAIVPGIASYTVTSDDPEVLDVIQLYGKSYLNPKQAGNATLNVTGHYLGSSMELPSVTVTVAGGAGAVSAVHIRNAVSTIGVGKTLALELAAEQTGGTLPIVPANGSGYTVESSDTSVISVTAGADAFLLTGIKNGEAVITFRYGSGDAAVSASKTFFVADGSAILTQQFDMDKLRAAINKPNAKLRPSLGTFWIPVEDAEGLGDQYSVSFDYYYPSRDSKYQQNNFVIWSSLENAAWQAGSKSFPVPVQSGPAVVQTGERVVIGNFTYLTDRTVSVDNAVVLTDALKSNSWHRFTIHYTPEGMGVYLDGELSPSGYFPTEGTVKIRNLGPFGDPLWPDAAKSPSASSGWAYYDNLILAADNGIINYSFDDAQQGSIKAQNGAANDDASMFIADDTLTDKAVFEPLMNNAPVSLLSMEAHPVQSSFSVGMEEPAREVLTLTGRLTDGATAPVEAGSLRYISLNPDIVSVEGSGRSAVFRFIAPGQATVTVECTLNGVKKTAEVSLSAVDGKQLIGLSITGPGATLLVGKKMPLAVSARYSDKTLATLAEDELSTLTIASSHPSVLAVEGGELRPLTAGEARITVSGSFVGVPYTAYKDFQVANVSELHVKALSAHFFVGDRIPLEALAMMSNGQQADVSAQAQFTVLGATGASIERENDTSFLLCERPGTYTVQGMADGQSARVTVEILPLQSSKTRSSYYTDEKRAIAQENIDSLAWAADVKKNAAAKGDKWLAAYDSLEELRSIVPSQGIGRSFAVNSQMGCLICGKAIEAHGNYAYRYNTEEIDWKLTCPSCGLSFPTNDFAAYYKGGLNAVGEFDPLLAKAHNDELIAGGEQGNLINLYAVNGLTAKQKGDILQAKNSSNAAQIEAALISLENDRAFGVDDGMGYGFNPNDKAQYGNPYTYVGYYGHFALWRGGVIEQMLEDLSAAYMYTSSSTNAQERARSQTYADAALILLDRIADVYPSLHVSEYPHNKYFGFTNSDGHWTDESRGRILGSIWENDIAKKILYAYDAVYPAIGTMSQEAKTVLAEMSQNPQKADAVRLRANFEHGFIREIHQAFKDGDLEGNPGMMQSTLALAAVVLDHDPDTTEWLNLDFRSGKNGWSYEGERTGGNVMEILVNGVDRDGQGDEVALGYNALWLDNWLVVANVLDGYSLPGGGTLDGGVEADLFQNIRFRQLFRANYPLLLTSNYTPNIGDTGKTGGTTPGIINMEQLIRGYNKFGGDELAQVIYLLNGKSSSGISLDIFSKNPNAIARTIEQVIATKGELDLGSTNKSAYGIGILRDGKDLSSSSYKGITYGFLDLSSTYSEGLIANRNYPPALQVEPKSVGQEITFDFSLAEDAGIYQLYLELREVDGWAQYDIILNGQKVAAHDFDYGVSGKGDNVTVKITDAPFRSGTNTITFRCAEAGYSGSLKMALRSMYLLRPGEQMPEEETQATTQRALWLFYGNRSASHNHADPMNLGYIAYDLDLMPDFGYPNTMGGAQNPEQKWDKSTAAHNTVSFDSLGYDGHVVGEGEIKRFDAGEYVQVMNASADSVKNSGTEYASQYDRTTALIRIDDESSYMVDLFRVEGISGTYQYNLHTGEVNSDATVYGGLTLSGQPVTYNDKTLRNVLTGSAHSDSFSVDWRLRDTWNRYLNGAHADTDVHMKVTMLGEYQNVRVGEAVPPTNITGNAPFLPVLMVTGSGKTTFVSVMEAYKASTQITAIDAVPVFTEQGAPADSQVVRAIRVTLQDGRTDTIVNSLDDTNVYLVDGKLRFSGFFGVYTEKDGEHLRSYLHDGTLLGDMETRSAVTGQVLDATSVLHTQNHIDVTVNESVSSTDLAGRYLYVDSSAISPVAGLRTYNAVYRIEAAEVLTAGTMRLHVGEQSVVRGWKNAEDLSQGYTLDFNLGASYRIPMTAQQGGSVDARELLEAYYREVQGSDSSLYTPASWNVFRTKLAHAEELLQQTATQRALLNALNELKVAFLQLQRVDTSGDGSNSGSASSGSSSVVPPVVVTNDDGMRFEVDAGSLPTGVNPSALRLAATVAAPDRVLSVLASYPSLPPVKSIALYDLELQNSSGEQAVFNGGATFRIPLGGASRFVRVFHYDGEDTLEEVPAVIHGDFLEIHVKHFSYYAIVDFASSAGELPKQLLNTTSEQDSSSPGSASMTTAVPDGSAENPRTGPEVTQVNIALFILAVYGCHRSAKRKNTVRCMDIS